MDFCYVPIVLYYDLLTEVWGFLCECKEQPCMLLRFWKDGASVSEEQKPVTCKHKMKYNDADDADVVTRACVHKHKGPGSSQLSINS